MLHKMNHSASSASSSSFFSHFVRRLLPFLFGTVFGIVISCIAFGIIASPDVTSTHNTHLAAFMAHSQTRTRGKGFPLKSERSFEQSDTDMNLHSFVGIDDLDIHGAAVHANHSTLKLLSCLETRGPSNAIIVPTRSHPSFAITVLDPNAKHTTSHALLRYGVDDVHILHVLAPLLHEECSKAESGLVVDTQANVGFIPFYAAAVGCNVVALEARTDMIKALEATMCANVALQPRIKLDKHVVSTTSGVETTYVNVDASAGDYPEETAEAHHDCSQHPGDCHELPSTTLATLLSDSAPQSAFALYFPHIKDKSIFLVRLSGDVNSVKSLMAATTLLASHRLIHVLLPFRPHLLTLPLAKQLIQTMDRHGYEIAELPFIDPENSFSLFQYLKGYIANSFTSLASYTVTLRYEQLDKYAETIFECSDKRSACKTDLLFTLMHGRFSAGITPFEGRSPTNKANTK